ncbi:MAG: glycogen synthase [Acidobacteriia bacterium]|nr:glycogen synthase [Terriglobia bacterium]
MRILMASTELWPLAKVGGLADMVGSLSRALCALGHEVRCALPRFPEVEAALPAGAHEVNRTEVAVRLAKGRTAVIVSRCEGGALPSPVLLFAHELFRRPGIYVDPATRMGYPDNGLRWALFCRAIHAEIGDNGFVPDVVHAHDHQAALLPALIRWGPPVRDRRPATVFTAHNLGYQGIEPRSWIEDSGLPEGLDFPAGPLEYHGRVNLMKLGLESADLLTTVSPRYAVEIRSGPEFGAGLEGVLAARAGRLRGILNGIDVEAWNPATDSHLPFRYDPHRLASKGKVKAALLEETGLEPPARGVPLVGMVTRLVSQKGIDLVVPVLDAILRDGIQVVILGTGEARFETVLRETASEHPGRLAFLSGQDEGIAHRIEAGSDMFLMPSRYEPCGLNQMYSLRYGTVPLVRAVGGLGDTVVDLDEDPDRANGFVFRAYEPAELLKTVRRAARAFRDRKLWRGLMIRGMAADFSWERPARQYVAAYAEAMSARVPNPPEAMWKAK